jgi:hypothetical protein
MKDKVKRDTIRVTLGGLFIGSAIVMTALYIISKLIA